MSSCSKLAIPGRSLLLQTSFTSASLLAKSSHFPWSSPAHNHKEFMPEWQRTSVAPEQNGYTTLREIMYFCP